MEKFRNKYRIATARAAWWDYASNAVYFVTICTRNKENYFGGIPDLPGRDAEMQLSDIGKIANECWMKIPDHFPFIHLDAFVVMPNHIHGILILDRPDQIVETQNIASLPPGNRSTVIAETQNIASLPPGNRSTVNAETQNIASLPPGNRSTVNAETQNIASLPVANPRSLNKFGPQSMNLASVIRGYKAGVTTRVRVIDQGFSWQPRYHDHIIRNDRSYQVISDYICKNPINWKKDQLYPDHE